MKPYAVTNAFNGTLASTSGYETGYEEPIYIYAPDNLKNATEAVVNNVNEKKKTATLYDTSKLKGKDKYAPVSYTHLISLTGMTRMVEEQRIEIGTMKALGYGNFSIASKYLGYALLATAGGSIPVSYTHLDVYKRQTKYQMKP